MHSSESPAVGEQRVHPAICSSMAINTSWACHQLQSGMASLSRIAPVSGTQCGALLLDQGAPPPLALLQAICRQSGKRDKTENMGRPLHVHLHTIRLVAPLPYPTRGRKVMSPHRYKPKLHGCLLVRPTSQANQTKPNQTMQARPSPVTGRPAASNLQQLVARRETLWRRLALYSHRFHSPRETFVPTRDFLFFLFRHDWTCSEEPLLIGRGK